MAGGGPFVYALGYFNHVLYQFDTRTRAMRSVAVGSAGGHVSRNFFADDRGHVYVPRVVRDGPDKLTASLVEFDPQLEEVSSHPLEEYFERGLDDSHGIVGVHPDGHGGWFHPSGARYVASMFRDEAGGRLFGVAASSSYGNRRFEWITLGADGRATVAPFSYGAAEEFPHGALLYGSIARDRSGRLYVAGTMKYKPVLLQITPQ